jgi:phospholipid transport system substrate-binding protein
MMMTNKSILISLVSLLACLIVNLAYAQQDPQAMLKSVADQLIVKLKENKTTLSQNPSLVYSLANKIVVPHADIDTMSRKVLPAQTWQKASESQRNQFEAEFTTLLVRTYASALANYTDQKIRFYPIRGGYQGKKDIQVKSMIERSDGPAISVNYKLLNKGTEWKVYDLIVEGVSLIESFRSQFEDQLAQGSMEDVLKQLAAHNTENAGN